MATEYSASAKTKTSLHLNSGTWYTIGSTSGTTYLNSIGRISGEANNPKVISLTISHKIYLQYKTQWTFYSQLILYDGQSSTTLNAAKKTYSVGGTQIVNYSYTFILPDGWTVNKINQQQTSITYKIKAVKGSTGGGIYLQDKVAVKYNYKLIASESSNSDLLYNSPDNNEEFNQYVDEILVSVPYDSPAQSAKIFLNGSETEIEEISLEEEEEEGEEEGTPQTRSNSFQPLLEDGNYTIISYNESGAKIDDSEINVKINPYDIVNINYTINRYIKEEESEVYIPQFDGEIVKIQINIIPLVNDDFELSQYKCSIFYDDSPIVISQQLIIDQYQYEFEINLNNLLTDPTEEEKINNLLKKHIFDFEIFKTINEVGVEEERIEKIIYSASIIVPRARPIINIEENGIAIGQFSNASSEDKRVEISSDFTVFSYGQFYANNLFYSPRRDYVVEGNHYFMGSLTGSMKVLSFTINLGQPLYDTQRVKLNKMTLCARVAQGYLKNFHGDPWVFDLIENPSNKCKEIEVTTTTPHSYYYLYERNSSYHYRIDCRIVNASAGMITFVIQCLESNNSTQKAFGLVNWAGESKNVEYNNRPVALECTKIELEFESTGQNAWDDINITDE